MKNLLQLPPSLLGFTLTYFLGGFVLGRATGNPVFMVYGAVLLLLTGLVLYLHHRFVLKTGLLWALSVWGFLHMAGGLVPVPDGWPIEGESRTLYSLWIVPDTVKFDQLVHLYGFGLCTFLCWEVIARAAFLSHGVKLTPNAITMAIVALGGMGIGAANEVAEFFATLHFADARVGGYNNTGWDLVYNSIGAVLASCLIHAKHRRASRAGRSSAASRRPAGGPSRHPRARAVFDTRYTRSARLRPRWIRER